MTKAWPLVALLIAVAGCGSAAKPDSGTTPTTSAGSGAVPTVSTPQEAATMADVPLYPGATFPNGKSQQPKKDESGKLHIYLFMETKDPVEKVVQFYQSAGQFSVLKQSNMQQLQGLSKKGNLELITVTGSPTGTTIDVKSVQGG